MTLEELESVARACAGVSDAVAEVVGDGGGQAVRVWVQRSAGATVGEDVVRAHLAAVLPVTVVPARVIMVDRLAVGETLKPNAPQREPEAVDHGSVADGPVGRLAAAVLGRPLEEAMNCFDAGFTSLSLLQPSAELSDLLQRPVEPLTLFQHPNLRALGAFLSGAGGDETTGTSAAARSRDGRAQRLDQMRARRHQARRWASRREDGQR